MINYIKGRLAYKGNDYIVVEAGGIGYKIFVSAAALSEFNYEDVQIFTYMNVSENDISLYGFKTSEELNMFYRLITVSGVGPKSAIGLLSSLTPSQIVFAIVSDDVKTISTGQGIGRKTAQRIILELKDKLSGDTGTAEVALKEAVGAMPAAGSNAEEAVEALNTLGFTRGEAAKAVSAVYVSGMTTEETVKLALKALS